MALIEVQYVALVSVYVDTEDRAVTKVLVNQPDDDALNDTSFVVRDDLSPIREANRTEYGNAVDLAESLSWPVWDINRDN